MIVSYSWPSGKTFVIYGELGWPSRSERVWRFDYAATEEE